MKFFSRSSSSSAMSAHEPSTHEWAEYNLPADLALGTSEDPRFDIIDAGQRLSSDDDEL